MKRLLMLAMLLGLAGAVWADSGGGALGGGGGGGASCSGGGAVSNQFLSALSNGCAATLSQPAFTNISGVATSAQGGTGNALQYTVNDRGATVTPACDFSLGYICRWAQNAGATMTASNIPGTATSPILVRTVAVSTAVNPGLALPATFWVLTIGSTQWTAGLTVHPQTRGGAAAVNDDYTWSCDGTNCFLVTPLADGSFTVLQASISLQIANDTTMTAAPRMAYAFSAAQQTALVANEHMGTFLTVKPITFDNATVDENNVTCAVNATVTCYDCGTSAGACTAAQTSTIWTSPAITSANTGLSVAGGALTTPPVAAGHYVTCEVTAGTCAVFQVGVSLDYKMQ